MGNRKPRALEQDKVARVISFDKPRTVSNVERQPTYAPRAYGARRGLDSPRYSQRQLLNVYRRLSKLYGIPRRRRSGTALDELVLTILSQNTNDRNSGEGFRRLKAAFADWAAVENAPWREVAAALRVAGLANIKSQRIQKILRQIRERHGDYTLEFLRKMPTAEARDYLLAIPGVGPKTAACVLLFSFGKPVFPVDTHIHRVTRRLGIIPEKMNAEAAHEELQKLVPPQITYPLHILLIRHGRDTCHAQRPECPLCVLLPICPAGKKLTAGFTTESTEDTENRIPG